MSIFIAPSVFYYVYFQYQSNLKFEIKRWNLNDRMTLYTVVLWVVLCIYFLSFCLFFSSWPLHCLSFTLRSLITPFWYSNFSRIVNYNTKYCSTGYKNHISVSFNCWARCIKSAARLYSQSSMFIDHLVI
jgi:hypothetical protein